MTRRDAGGTARAGVADTRDEAHAPPIPAWRSDWKHLRLPYQLTLAPLFLWGCVLAGFGDLWGDLTAFAALHLFLYPGITAYNTWFDRDEGPIGGMERPPRIHDSLLVLALALKAIGSLFALAAGVPIAAIYLVFVLLSVLYSHPRSRWKADPWRSAAVVCIGQGGLGYLAGWSAARGNAESVFCAPGLLGLASAALTTLGMYPLTQLFQIEEDRQRGDHTLCIALGPRAAVGVSQISFLLAGVAAAGLAIGKGAVLDAGILGLAYAVLSGIARRLGRRCVLGSRRSLFRPILALNYAASAGFALFIILRASRW